MSDCAHRFVRIRRWPVKDRFGCVDCGHVTRRLDTVDRMGQRPIHPHMSVACTINTFTARALWRQAVDR